jgi:hypothetical protein
MALMIYTAAYDHPLRVEVQHIALSIVSGTGYGNPFISPTGPTAIYTPVCPLLLAGIYRVFGAGTGGEAAAYVLTAIFASLVWAMLPVTARLLGLPRSAGLLAAFTGALVPFHFLLEFRMITSVCAALVLQSLCLLAAACWRRGHWTVRSGVLHGAVLGLSVLTAPSAIPVALGWLCSAFVLRRRAIARFSLALCLAALVTVLPWIVRNKLVLGSPIVTRSNLGLELQIANNDYAGVSIADNLASNGSFARYHPMTNPEEAGELRRRGEAVYMNDKLRQALRWISKNPLRFFALTLSRIRWFWFPSTYRIAQTALIWALTLMAWLGLIAAWRPHRLASVLISCIWLLYPMIYYVVQWDNVYRYPLDWTVLLFASYGLHRLASAGRRWSKRHNFERVLQ